MNPILMALFGLLTHADTIEPDAINLYATLAHGEGGLGKVQAGLSALAKLVEDAVTGTTPQIPVPPTVVAAHTDAAATLSG
jgi:hypothetical protein